VNFTCKASVDGNDGQCQITLEVMFPMQDVKIMPSKSRYYVGEEVKCQARGNPKPQVRFTTRGAQEHDRGSDWVSVKIPQDWLNKTVTLDCEATVTYPSRRTETGSATFLVTEKPVMPDNGATMKTVSTATISTLITIGLLNYFANIVY